MSEKIAISSELHLLFDATGVGVTLADVNEFLMEHSMEQLMEFMELDTEEGTAIDTIIYFGRVLQKYGADMQVSEFAYLPMPNAYGHPDWSHLE